MSRKNIDFSTLKEVVNDMGKVFTTKDVSEDPRTKAANQEYVYHSHYHVFVGGALSDHLLLTSVEPASEFLDDLQM